MVCIVVVASSVLVLKLTSVVVAATFTAVVVVVVFEVAVVAWASQKPKSAVSSSPALKSPKPPNPQIPVYKHTLLTRNRAGPHDENLSGDQVFGQPCLTTNIKRLQLQQSCWQNSLRLDSHPQALKPQSAKPNRSRDLDAGRQRSS